MGWRHKSIEGLGIDDVHRVARPADDMPKVDVEPVTTRSENDEASSKILKAAIGGVAAGALLAGIYELAHHHLSKKKEQ